MWVLVIGTIDQKFWTKDDAERWLNGHVREINIEVEVQDRRSRSVRRIAPRSVVARINRVLKLTGRRLVRSRHYSQALRSAGTYSVTDLETGVILMRGVRVEEIARELGCLTNQEAIDWQE